MRGEDRTTDQLFAYVNVEDRIASDHPLRQIRQLANDALKGPSPGQTLQCLFRKTDP